MKGKAIAGALMFFSFTGVVSAHRLDEYLQATLISVEKDRVEVSMRLIPGVAVSSAVISSIDTNADGNLSSAEQSAYAQRVLSELSLSIDGRRLRPQLVSANFPQIQEMREGVGEIHIEYTADVPRGGQPGAEPSQADRNTHHRDAPAKPEAVQSERAAIESGEPFHRLGQRRHRCGHQQDGQEPPA